MENVPAMEEQMASTEPLADAALPAAETAAETPTPIAAPPGVPMEAPPPSLLAKEEAKETAPAPEIGQLYFERRFTSGITGLASTNRGSAPDTDSDPIEWGDMDPNFRQALQVTMENLSTVLATYHEQTVQPSLDLLSNHIRQDVISRLDKQGSVIRYEGLALQSLEAD
ncbi:unnamed protein product, partial [Symbiodinium sp. KB8]